MPLGLRVDEQHTEDIRCHQDEHEHGNHVDSHVLVIPPRALSDASRSAGIGRDDQPPPQAPVGSIPAAQTAPASTSAAIETIPPARPIFARRRARRVGQTRSSLSIQIEATSEPIVATAQAATSVSASTPQ